MKKSYLNGTSCISAQPIDEDFLWKNPVSYQTTEIKAQHPNYKKYIKPAAMRRMSQSVKMGVAAAFMALNDAKVEKPDAIIAGTGRGCQQDSNTFLEDMLEKNETFLTPIKFIQSTHNTVGGRIALELNCNAYNLTYVQSGASFESALLDGYLGVLGAPEMNNVLVGGIDELTKNSVDLLKRNGHLKQEEEIHNLDLLKYQTSGSLISEGAAFFVLSSEKTNNSYAELVDVDIVNQASPEAMEGHIAQFLKNNHLSMEKIDAVVLGNNGDSEFDRYYEKLQRGILKNTVQCYYKHLVGEHYTVSAFGMWLACEMLQRQFVPEFVKLTDKNPEKPLQNILLYNQNRGRNHSLVLLSAC